MRSYHLHIENVGPRERFALDAVRDLFCDPHHAVLLHGFLDGTQAITIDRDTGEIVPAQVVKLPEDEQVVAVMTSGRAPAQFEPVVA